MISTCYLIPDTYYLVPTTWYLLPTSNPRKAPRYKSLNGIEWQEIADTFFQIGWTWTVAAHLLATWLSTAGGVVVTWRPTGPSNPTTGESIE